ncbi:hypothetical protein EJB05_23710 [Eragrostis curvula]|uniref:DUF1618 domain-containing protein n=1 Tax=Eragrostis curvula TaxID=38414 RepID=A0A5J9V924_9POAL|nr:hypothetical protein EJB05_23710 [Eragrostis curvula]
MSTSSRGSAMPEPGASAFGYSGFPAWALIDTTALIGHCDNETTAHGTTRDGRPIQVSFVVVNPPALSRCVVYCPDLTASSSASPALVTGADGAFLLIRVFFPKRDGKRHFSDVFVYKAGSPSLLRIPEPYPVRFLSTCVGVLTCGDAREHCSVVVPECRFDADGWMRYDLHVFSTMTKSWSTKVARVACDSELHYCEFEPSKVFSIGGVSLAWVDLRQGILLCKQVEKDPVMHLIELPVLLPTNTARYALDSDGCGPPLDRIRDVTFSNGWFRFVELEFIDSGTSPSGWRVTVFKRKTESEDWKQICTVDTRLSPANSCLPYLFPEICDYQEKTLALTNVICSFPLLDEFNKNVIYMISRVKAGDTYGWILAINFKDRKLEKVVPFSVERLFTQRSYLQCSFSSYLNKAPGTPLTIELEKCTNRERIDLLESSLMSALNHLRGIEIHMESVKQRYNGSLRLLSAGSPSLDLKYNGIPLFYPSLIQTVSFTSDSYMLTGAFMILFTMVLLKLPKYSHHLMMGDLELQVSAPIDTVKNKIRVAHGALYK